LANRLIATLEKVYRDRVLQFENHLAEGFDVPGDENDFMEVLGNLLDNAAKFARTRVRIDFRETDDEVRFWVEDDGPGIDPDKVAQVLVRGGRLDEQHPGQGIGLASVDTIVGLYGGELGIDRSPELGGARISVRMGRKSRSS
jgi:two-component system sensor histidine kinase PhoQ